MNFIWKSEKQKMEMKKENKYDFAGIFFWKSEVQKMKMKKENK